MHLVWILSILFLALILVLLLVSYLGNRKSLVIVTDPDELANQKGLSEYFDRFSECDVAARAPLGCATKEAYVSLLLKSSSKEDAAFLNAAVEKAQRAIERASATSLSNFLKVEKNVAQRVIESIGDTSVPWKVAILDERAENGWPHTHGYIICIPRTFRSMSNLVRTLVHERVHVIQRRRPDLFRDAIAVRKWGMTPIPIERAHLSDVMPFRRSNPDLDGFLYATKQQNIIPISLFDSIQDATNGGLGASRVRFFKDGQEVKGEHHGEEHPYETQAYLISEALVA